MRDKEKHKLYMRDYRRNNAERINARRRELRKESPEKYRETDRENYTKNPLRYKLKKYNISQEEYLKLLDKQNSKCAICGNDMTQINVDHNHETGKVRGLLCTSCNTGIGKLKDDIRILESAINYLRCNCN